MPVALVLVSVLASVLVSVFAPSLLLLLEVDFCSVFLVSEPEVVSFLLLSVFWVEPPEDAVVELFWLEEELDVDDLLELEEDDEVDDLLELEDDDEVDDLLVLEEDDEADDLELVLVAELLDDVELLEVVELFDEPVEPEDVDDDSDFLVTGVTVELEDLTLEVEVTVPDEETLVEVAAEDDDLAVVAVDLVADSVVFVALDALDEPAVPDVAAELELDWLFFVTDVCAEAKFADESEREAIIAKVKKILII